MLTKQQTAQISQWKNHQQGLEQYGHIVKTMAKEDLAKIATLAGRKEDYVNSMIPNNCVIEIRPNDYVVIWIQIKGWYGAEKDYVCFSPDTKEKKQAFLEIANKYVKEDVVKEEVDYFPY